MTDRRNVYGMDYTIERSTVGSKCFGTLAEVLGYGCYDDYENDTFKYIPFDYDIDGGEDETCRPLFIHKKTGFKMYWYKYPLRYAYCNKENVDSKFLKYLVDDCVNSLPEEKQEEYNNIIIKSKFKEHLNSPVFKADSIPNKVEEYIRDADKSIKTIIERNSDNEVIRKINLDKDGIEIEVFDYLSKTYQKSEYETIATGKIIKMYKTSLKDNNDYSDSTFILDKRIILENKNGMKIKVETEYFYYSSDDIDEETSVMIDYEGSSDYTNIKSGNRETYLHDGNKELVQLITTDIYGHMNIFDVDTVKETDGTVYHFANNTFIASKRDEYGRTIMNANGVEVILSTYDDDNRVKTRTYYDTILVNEDYAHKLEMMRRRMFLNSTYGVGGLHKTNSDLL